MNFSFFFNWLFSFPCNHSLCVQSSADLIRTWMRRSSFRWLHFLHLVVIILLKTQVVYRDRWNCGLCWQHELVNRLGLWKCLCFSRYFSINVILAWTRLFDYRGDIEPLCSWSEHRWNLFLRFDFDVHIIDKKHLLKILISSLGIRLFLFVGFRSTAQWLRGTKRSHSKFTRIIQRRCFVLAWIYLDLPGEGVLVTSKPVFLWLCTKNDIKNNFINTNKGLYLIWVCLAL